MVTPVTPITVLPDTPSRADPTNFAAKGDAFLGALPTFRTELNALGSATETNATEANASAASALTSELVALGSANYQGDYAPGTTYSRGQSVTYNNYFYYSKVNSNLGNQPDISPTQWAESSISDIINNVSFDGTDVVVPGLKVTNNTTIGDSASDTLTINAQTWSVPNGFVVDSTKLVLNGNNLGLGTATPTSASGTSFAINGGAGQSRIALKNNISGDTSTDGFQIACDSNASAVLDNREISAMIFRNNDVEGGRLTATRFAKFSNSGTYGSVAGLGSLIANDSHNVQSDQNNTTLAAINGNTGSTVTNYDSHLATGAAGKHYAGYVNTALVYAVAANGDVTNTNNSYGALSDRKLKNLLRRKYGKDYYDRFKQIRFWVYSLINDPTNQELLGVVAQELQDIFPGLVESTPDMHEVKKSRAVIKKIQRTRTEQQSKTNRTIEEVDGRWTLIEETETVDVEVPMFEEHQVFDQNGNPVMQLVKAGVPEVLDANGKVLQPAVEPVYLPVIHRVPVIDEIEEQQEYTESVQKINPETGDPEVTLSVRYSILYQIAAMVTQELQFRNDEHTLIISDQTKEIALLTARIEALENK